MASTERTNEQTKKGGYCYKCQDNNEHFRSYKNVHF